MTVDNEEVDHKTADLVVVGQQADTDQVVKRMGHLPGELVDHRLRNIGYDHWQRRRDCRQCEQGQRPGLGMLPE